MRPMMRVPRGLRLACACFGLLLGTGGAVDALAAPPTLVCGATISRDTTLKADLGPCPADGLVVVASDITLNLGGHKVFGAFDEVHGVATGNHAGVRLVNVRDVAVKNGEVSHFAAGVAVHGGNGNSFKKLDLHHNVGWAGTNDLGDGLVLFDSVGNTIASIRAHHNGPFSGVALIGGSTDNRIVASDLSDNATHDLCGRTGGIPGPGPGSCVPYQVVWGEDMGLRLEGPGTMRNIVSGNQINRNGSDGILVAMTCPNFEDPVNFPPPCLDPDLTQSYNVIKGNTINDNGVHGAPSAPGSGILLHNLGVAHAPSHNTISDNVVLRNERNGIAVSVGSHHNSVLRNTATGSGSLDGLDGNAACDSNTWLDNTLGTFNQPCMAGQTKTKPSGAASLTTDTPPPGVGRKAGMARAPS